MFDRFTDRARKCMGFARMEAQRFNHDYIGTEHMLLGLIREGSGVATDVLKNLDVDPKRIRRGVEDLVSHGTTMVTMGQLPFTKQARKALELSLAEASALGHNYIGTEHLLLGLICEEKGIGGQVLRELNVRLENVRDEIRELLGDEGDEPDDMPGPLAPRVRRAMDLASLIAHHERQEAIDTEHILLGIIDDASGGLGLPDLLLQRLRAQVVGLMKAGTSVTPTAPVALTPAAKAALDHAFLAARDAGASRVGINHVLAGLMREKEGIAARVLLANGLDPETALAKTPAPGVVGRVMSDEKQAMGLARLEAQRFRHDCIDTEHMLLGLVAAGGVAAGILRKLGFDPQRVREETEKRMTRGTASDAPRQLPFTPAVKTVLDLALEEANKLQHGWIGGGHLLLGLVREGRGIAAQVLAELAVTADATRKLIDPGPPAPPD